MRLNLLLGAVLIAVLLVPSCDTSEEPTTGALRVITHTTGGDLDFDGYVATVDQVPYTAFINDTVIVPDLATGSHDVELGGVAGNCQPSDVAQSGAVKGGDTTDVTFDVVCVATGIRVTIATSGVDLDPNGYDLLLDNISTGLVSINAFREVTRLLAGVH